MEMSDNEAYMLQRDSKESSGLEEQHDFLKALANGHLIHPCIHAVTIRAIADVGTDTGVWLRDVAQALESRRHPDTELLGFGISPEKFSSQNDRLDFVVHDMTKPFHQRYHTHFDLVNVRLLSHALKAQQLKQAVANVVQLLRQYKSQSTVRIKERPLIFPMLQVPAGISNGKKQTLQTLRRLQRPKLGTQLYRA